MCGWPGQGGRCPACGAVDEPAPARRDQAHPALAPPSPDDYPDLKGAFVAWNQRDWARMMGQCLIALGIDQPRVSKRPRGPGWAFVQDSAAIYVMIDTTRQTISIESPVLALPATRRVSLLRVLLELNAGATGLARFYLRRDVVLLGFTDQLANVSPPKLVRAVRDVALRADEYDDALAIGFDAEMLGPKAQRLNLDWSVVGEPIALTLPDVEVEAPAPLPADALIPIEPQDHQDLYDDQPLALDLQLSADDFDDTPPGPDPATELVALVEHALRQIGLVDAPEARALVERAALFHIRDRFHATCPDPVNLLLGRAQSMLQPSWGKTERGLGGALSRLGSLSPTPTAVRPYLEFVMREIVVKRAAVGAQPAPAIPSLTASTEGRELLQRIVGFAEHLPDSVALQHFVYSGVILEILTRFAIGDKTRDRLRLELEQHAEARPEGVLRLSQIVGRLAQ